MESVLEKCGADDKFIENLTEKGLFVSKIIQRNPNALHPSHAQKTLYELEETIPRFTKEEREEYIKEPYKFYTDGLKAAELCSWIIGELIDIVGRVKKIENKEEKIASALVLIRIFFANYDFNLQRYDRDIEYYEFEESITGYFWQKLLKLCKIAFEEKGEERFLNLIGGTPFFYKTIKYSLAKSELKNRLISYENIDAKKILEQLSINKKDLYNEIVWIAEHFYKYPEDVIKESLTEKESINLEKIIEKKKKEYQYFLDGYRILLSKNFVLAEEFNDSYRAVEVLMRLNEKIGAISSGKTPQNNGYFYNDSLLSLFDVIREAVEKHDFVKKEKSIQVKKILEKVDEMKVIGITPGIKYFLMKFEENRFFSDKINDFYDSELKRWISF